MLPASAWANTTKREVSGTEVSKRVVVVASGVTERTALPSLTRHLASEGIEVDEVLFPRGHGPIDVANTAKLIRSVWFGRVEQERPDKFVVLVDTDREQPEAALEPLSGLRGHLGDIRANIRFAYAQPHLEAWFFADAKGLRKYLGRALGAVDSSKPDTIENPKLRLKHLLDSKLYTSLVSQEIAAVLDVATIEERSPSFRGFVAAVRNGDPA